MKGESWGKMVDGIFRDVFMGSAQTTVCEYKTRVFGGRQEVPVGASNAQNDGDLRFSMGPQEAHLCDRWKLFFPPACFCIK